MTNAHTPPAKGSDKAIDQRLVERVCQGDKKAFDILVLKYQHRIMKLAERFVRNNTDAQDITQEVFIRAYRALPRFHGDSAFYTWLYRIAVNTSKNWLSTRSHRMRHQHIELDDAELYTQDRAMEDRDTPENLYMRNEVGTVVFDTIEQLPDELRIAITLREIDGMSYQDIANSMDCPVGTVRSRIFRAREAISQKLDAVLEPSRSKI